MTQSPDFPEVLALIPARGGSKSIPRKNLVVIAGKPLIAHSILQAQQSQWITRVLVSTDDREIAEVALKYGAEVPFIRPKEFAQDHSTDLEVFRHALQTLRDSENYKPDFVVHLRPTHPVRKIAVIDAAIQKFFESPEADSLRSVSRPLQTPYKMWRTGAEGYLEPVISLPGIKESYNLPRQALPQVHWQNGYIDIVRPSVVLEKNEMCGDRILPWIIEEPLLEIDYPGDLRGIESALSKESQLELRDSI